MSEQLLAVHNQPPAEVSRLLREKGLRVVHRFGSTLVVESASAQELDSDAVKRVASTVVVPPLADLPADARDDELLLLAFRLRQTERYRRTKRVRSTQDEDWGRILAKL